MATRKGLHPVQIDTSANILKIASCSCPYVCRHSNIYAMDYRKNIYKSTDATSFSLDEKIAKMGKIVNIIPTEIGTALITDDNRILTPDHEEYNPSLHQALTLIKGAQREHIANLHITKKSTSITLKSGSAVVSITTPVRTSHQGRLPQIVENHQETSVLGFYFDENAFSTQEDRKIGNLLALPMYNGCLLVGTQKGGSNIVISSLNSKYICKVSLSNDISCAVKDNGNIVFFSSQGRTIYDLNIHKSLCAIIENTPPALTRFPPLDQRIKRVLPGRVGIATVRTLSEQARIYTNRFYFLNSEQQRNVLQNPYIASLLPSPPIQQAITTTAKSTRVNILMSCGKIVVAQLPSLYLW